jgi:transposase-like protein
MARYRSHSLQFKRQIAQEFLEGRAGMHELARRHNLSRNLIRLWIQRFETGELNDDLANAERITEYEAKIAELERKVGQLTMEIDFLKNCLMPRAAASPARPETVETARVGNRARSNGRTLIGDDANPLKNMVSGWIAHLIMVTPKAIPVRKVILCAAPLLGTW